MSFQRIKYLRINPTKDDKNIYTETYKFAEGYKGGGLKKNWDIGRIKIFEISNFIELLSFQMGQ